MVPGEWLLSNEPIEINAGQKTLRTSVRNTGDRPIQVGSHFHFFEVNRALDFDRPSTLGMLWMSRQGSRTASKRATSAMWTWSRSVAPVG